MSRDIIWNVIGKGETAGKLLTEFNFEHHQWVRFLVLMNQLEQNFGKIREVIAVQPLEQLLIQQAGAYMELPYPYCRDQEWCDEAKKFVDGLTPLMNSWYSLAESWETSQKLRSSSNIDVNIPTFFYRDVPEPDPVLRMAPEV